MSDVAPEGWKLAPLSGLARVVSGGTPSRDVNFYWGGDIPWVTPTDITRTNGRYLFETQENITRLGLSSSAATLLPPGSILMTSRATVGESRIAEMEVCTNQGFKSLVPQKGVNGLFLYYQMQRLRGAYKVFGIGSTFLEVSKKDTERFNVLMPTNEGEQQAIAAVIDSVDVAIEKTEALIAKYQQIKAGLMHDLFTRGVTADGKLRPPREQAPELYQETPIGWIPKEWEVSGLKARALPGIPHLRMGPFGSSLKGEHWVDEGHPVITIGALGEGTFIESELLFVGEADANRLKDFQLKEGEVVFSRVADVGRSIVIRKEQIGWIMSSNLMRISLDRKRAIPEMLQQQLAFDDRLKRQIKAKVNSGGRDVANSEILNQLLFVWPTYVEQQLMVERAAAIDCQLRAEEDRLGKFQQQKLGLMSDLLTGKVRVVA